MELLGAVALIAILTSLALPGMSQLLRTYRVRTVASDFSAELFWAQAEAARRGSAMALRLKTAADCQAKLAGAPRRCGWYVFLDKNQDGLQQANEATLHNYDNPADLTIEPKNGDTVFIDATGNLLNKASSSGAVGTSFLVEMVQAKAGDPASRRVCINAGNRVRVASGSVCLS